MVGFVVSLLMAAGAAVVAWPHLRPACQGLGRPPGSRKVASVTSLDASPNGRAPARERGDLQTGDGLKGDRRKRAEQPPQVEVRAETRPEPAALDDGPPPTSVSTQDRSGAGEDVDPRADQHAGRAADAVVELIATAASGIRGGDTTAAHKALEAAAAAAGTDSDLTARVARWRLLVDYVTSLDGLVSSAIASANQGRDYTIGDRTISVIEIGPETYAFKEAGRIVRGPRASLPRVVERAILRSWCDGDPRPANGIYMGVHRLLDDQVDLAKVREEWLRALEGEPATAAIMPLLDDPLITPSR